MSQPTPTATPQPFRALVYLPDDDPDRLGLDFACRLTINRVMNGPAITDAALVKELVRYIGIAKIQGRDELVAAVVKRAVVYARFILRKHRGKICQRCQTAVSAGRWYVQPGTGPHAAKMVCGNCDRFLCWLPGLDGVGRQL